MSINFPAAPVEGQTFEAEGVQYVYTNGIWAVIYADPTGLEGVLMKSGGTMTGSLTVGPNLNVKPPVAGASPNLVLQHSEDGSELGRLWASNDRNNVLLRKADAAGAVRSQLILADDDVRLSNINTSAIPFGSSVLTLDRLQLGTKRILGLHAPASPTTYSLTGSTGGFVGGSDAVHIAPASPTSQLLVDVDISFYIQANGGTTMRSSFAFGYFTGTAWAQLLAANHGINYTSNGGNIFYGSRSTTNIFGVGARRSDNGQWSFRVLINSPYATQITNVSHFYVRAIEYEP